MGFVCDKLLNRKLNCALIPFFTAEYTTVDSKTDVFSVLIRSGANVIEIGIPCADALANGPTIYADPSEFRQTFIDLDSAWPKGH